LFAAVREIFGRRILGGPFNGMRYIPRACGSAFWPKVFGTYEMELVTYLEVAIARSPSVIIDIGAAEGYYAVGLLRRTATAHCIAYEMEGTSRQALSELAAANAVDGRLDARETCSSEELARVLNEKGEDAFVLCDVEGAEEDILSSTTKPLLRNACMLVEVHETERPGVLSRLLARFEDTHHAHFIPARLPKLTEIDNGAVRMVLRLASIVAPRMARKAVWERPAGMCFLFLVPKGAAC
jgi:hypothetical protein